MGRGDSVSRRGLDPRAAREIPVDLVSLAARNFGGISNYCRSSARARSDAKVRARAAALRNLAWRYAGGCLLGDGFQRRLRHLPCAQLVA